MHNYNYISTTAKQPLFIIKGVMFHVPQLIEIRNCSDICSLLYINAAHAKYGIFPDKLVKSMADEALAPCATSSSADMYFTFMKNFVPSPLCHLKCNEKMIENANIYIFSEKLTMSKVQIFHKSH